MPSRRPDPCGQSAAGPLPYRQGPADTGEHAGQAEEVRQVEGEDHDQVANGDHLKVAVGAVARPQRAPHADEGDQQRGLGWEHRDIRGTPTQGTNDQTTRTSLEVQWLRLCTSTAGGSGSIPGQGTNIPHAQKKQNKIK